MHSDENMYPDNENVETKKLKYQPIPEEFQLTDPEKKRNRVAMIIVVVIMIISILVILPLTLK